MSDDQTPARQSRYDQSYDHSYDWSYERSLHPLRYRPSSPLPKRTAISLLRAPRARRPPQHAYEWVKAASRADLRIRPVVSEILSAYDETSANPWLHQLTEYRNLFLHRQPLGSSSARSHLIYNVLTKDGIGYPRIEMPLGDTDPSAPGQDALTRFIQLYRAMTDLVKLAAEHAPYSSEPETFVVR